jgi:cellulose synthase/poly-beta-1,6-N-acetylglucosamine synthase-like glycosyltransferase
VFVLETVFWGTLALIVYAYVGFAMLLAVRSLCRKPTIKLEITPSVTLIVIAHNEEESIGAKLENILALDYPHEQLQVLIGSDGSDDNTHAIVRSYADQNIELHVCPRQGKIPTLNATVAHATGEILVFSDANSMFDVDSIRALTRCFADESVGAVAGNQCYNSDSQNAASFAERMYWNFDRFLKQAQSAAGNATSSTGAIHAIRRQLFHPVPSGVSDDFVISTRAIEQGYRLIFEPDAIAREAVAPTDKAEFSRKSRVIARGLRGLWAVNNLFNPFRFGFYSVQLASHKLLRWSVVWLLPILFITSGILAQTSLVGQLFLAAQVVFYGAALIAFLFRTTTISRWRTFRMLSIPYYFCLVNVASAQAWGQVILGRKIDVWSSKRTSSNKTIQHSSNGIARPTAMPMER